MSELHVRKRMTLKDEQPVLGTFLISDGAFAEARSAGVSDSHFSGLKHKVIFRAMARAADKGDPIDVVTVTTALKEVGEYAAAGGAHYLAEILEATAKPTYVTVVRE